MVGISWCKNWWRVSISTPYITLTPLGFELRHPLFDATILKQGAQLIAFQPKKGKPLLWSADISTFEKGKAFRGGIPLCWPWFGKAGSPSHGFARLLEWELLGYDVHEEGVRLCFELRDSLETRALWDYAFTLHLEMKLSHDVEISLHIDAEKESTGALHTYVACHDIHTTMITGLGRHYRDALQGGVVCETSHEPLSLHKAVDRIYTQPEPVTSLEEVRIHHENHSDVVLWNPWSEGEVMLKDMQKNDYAHMICIESARISRPFTCKDSLHVKLKPLLLF